MKLQIRYVSVQGFSLIEVMMALGILAFGLLAAGQLLYVMSASNSLARSKSTAILAAQDTLESLGALYHRDPAAPDLALGGHGPQSIEVRNPANGSILNRYSIHWRVATVSDPRSGKMLQARRVSTTIAPVNMGGAANNQVGLNKVINVSTVFSQEMQ